MKFDANGFNVFNRANFILATVGGGANNKYTRVQLRSGGRHAESARTAVRREVQLLTETGCSQGLVPAGREQALFLSGGILLRGLRPWTGTSAFCLCLHFLQPSPPPNDFLPRLTNTEK